MNPRANKNAITINQIVLELNVESVCSTVKVLVKTQAAMLSMAIAPIGSGFTTIHTIDVMKIANRCQTCVERPAGAGVNHIPNISANMAKAGLIFTPSQPPDLLSTVETVLMLIVAVLCYRASCDFEQNIYHHN